MFPVSDAFMDAIANNTRKYYRTGTIVTKNKKQYSFGKYRFCGKICLMPIM